VSGPFIYSGLPASSNSMISARHSGWTLAEFQPVVDPAGGPERVKGYTLLRFGMPEIGSRICSRRAPVGAYSNGNG